MPKVSVLMPVYNTQAYLAEAVESILNQTFRDFEFIIIDDGSTDRSLEILRRYEKQDSRIRLISRENRGLVKTLNEMLAITKGEFIARMDADDVSPLDRLVEQMAYLRGNTECVAVGCRVLLVDPEGWPISEAFTETSHEAIDEKHISGAGAALCQGACLFRSEAIAQVGGFRADAFTAEDLDLFLRLAEMGRIASIPKVLLHYRMHHGSIGHDRAALQKRTIWQVVDAARHRRGMAPLPEMSERASNSVTPAANQSKWAWWALAARNVRTARKHAAKVAVRRPFSLETWRLVACALRGR